MNDEPPRRKLNDELVQMARCIAELGPNVNQVAHATGRFKETVRYRFHRFFVGRGIKAQAMPSYARLGFKRLILIARLAPACEASAKSIFNALSELCYLHSYTRVLLRDEYVLNVAVPSELAEGCAGVYMDLERSGVFTELEILAFDEMRNPPMKPDQFDFVRGRWTVDWAEIKANHSKLPLSVRPKVERYDKTDLLILKELEIDAGRTLAKMVESVNISINALEFHYREHVKPRGLIKGYRLVWQGTKYDFERQMPVSRKDIYLELAVLLQDGTPEEVAELMMLLNSTPFLWCEAYGSAYYAEQFIPHSEYAAFLDFLDKFASKVRERLRIFILDQSDAARFVISYPLFDAESKRWQLDSRAVLRTLGNLAPTLT